MRKRLWLIWFVFMVVVSVQAQNDTVVFSARGGFYDEVFSLELYHAQPQNHIRYTTNGNRPTAQSPLYEEALVLDERCYSKSNIYTILDCPESDFFLPDSVPHCIVIRAAVFDENDSCVSQVVTNSYFIHALGCDTHGLPVVSLCSDSLALFDYDTGIFVPGVHYVWWSPNSTGNYFQRGREWERLCNVEFYENDNTGINQQAGLKTHGGATRALQQKNLKILAREEYGKKRFKHQFFQEIPHNSFKHLVLKPFCCGIGNTTGILDALSQSVVRGLDVDALAFRFSVVYLNGEYWGIYALQETPDERYVEDHYGYDADEINIIKNWNELDHGDSTNWLELFHWVEDADLSIASNYEEMEERIDMNNFIDYWIFEMYSCNYDWPGHNTRNWQRGDGKWRWIFFDGDACFSWDIGTFEHAVDTTGVYHVERKRATLFFRKLIENPLFLDRFTDRFNELLSGQLQYSYIVTYYNQLSATIASEIPHQCHRFGFPSNVEEWERDLVRVDGFLTYLNDRIQTGLNEFYEQHHTGLQESLAVIQCYPNPFSDEIRLSFEADDFSANEIAIYDMLGRKVFAKPCRFDQAHPTLTFHPHLEAGVYVLKVGEHTQKIVRY